MSQTRISVCNWIYNFI